MTTDSRAQSVLQLRVIVPVDDFDAALRFYRDGLGLTEQAAFEGDGDARVAILEAGRATIELANAAQMKLVDEVEVGRELDPGVRLALEVDDIESGTSALVEAGAALLGGPVETPWRSVNTRVVPPAGLQLTLFQELESLDDRSQRAGFGTEPSRRKDAATR